MPNWQRRIYPTLSSIGHRIRSLAIYRMPNNTADADIKDSVYISLVNLSVHFHRIPSFPVYANFMQIFRFFKS